MVRAGTPAEALFGSTPHLILTHWNMKMVRSLSLLVALAAPADAALIASTDFSGGNGTANFNQFQGTAGGGWIGGWAKNGQVTGSAVEASPELSPGSGNHLSVVVAGGLGTGQTGSNWRQYNPTAALSNNPDNLPISISWEFRLDTELNGKAVNIQDRNDAGGVTAATSSFGIRVYPSSSGSGSMEVPGNFAFYDGEASTSDYSVNRFFDSGIQAVVGTTYQMRVDLYPNTQTWDLYIAELDNPINSVFKQNLGFRRTAAGLPAYLGFGTSSVSLNANPTMYSIDNLQINLGVIPEPSTVSLGITGMLALSALAWRKGRQATEQSMAI